MFQNHRLYFQFCLSEKCYKHIKGETNITVYEEDPNDLYKDFFPDEAIMKDLFKSLWTGIPSLFQRKKPLNITRTIPRTKKKFPKLMLPL